MIDAAVGFQCPECVATGLRETRAFELPYGGVRVEDPRRTTMVLIGLNLVLFVVVMAMRSLADVLALTPAGVCMSVADPGSYYPRASLAACQAMTDGNWVPGVASGRWWQVITSAFLHTQPWHIGLNMVALWMLGPNLERVLGRARFLAVYVVSALAGSAGVMWLSDPDSSSVGASGAIFGLFAALALLIWKVRGDFRQIMIVLAINVGVSLMPGISWQAHLGGFLGGLVAAAIIVFAPKQSRTTVQWAGIGLLTLFILGVTALRAVTLG